MSDFTKLKTKKNGKEYVLNACTQDTEQNITGTKNFSKLTVNSKNVVTSINGVNADENGNVDITTSGADLSGVVKSVNGIQPDESGNVQLGSIVKSVNSIVPDENGNVQLGNLGALTGAVTGKIEWFAFNTPPDGYLVCNGAKVSRETYADLFAVIGTTFGSGDGATTFTLPNLIDKFIQGSTTVGTYKSAGLPNITGSISGFGLGNAGGGAFYIQGSNNGFSPSGTDVPYPNNQRIIYISASRSSSIYGNSTTVQPPALTLLPCIKY